MTAHNTVSVSVIVKSTGQKVGVRLPREQISVGRLVPLMVKKLNLPPNVSYYLVGENNEQLDDSMALSELGIQDGNTLTLVPHMQGGLDGDAV